MSQKVLKYAIYTFLLFMHPKDSSCKPLSLVKRATFVQNRVQKNSGYSSEIKNVKVRGDCKEIHKYPRKPSANRR